MNEITWLARYNDGTELAQYNEDGSENTYGKIDRSKLESFCLIRDNQVVLEYHLEPDQRLIYRRRTYNNPNFEGGKLVVYIVGWQQTIHNTNIQSITYVLEDGQIHVAGAWQDDHWLYFSPKRTPEDDQNFVFPDEQ